MSSGSLLALLALPVLLAFTSGCGLSHASFTVVNQSSREVARLQVGVPGASVDCGPLPAAAECTRRFRPQQDGSFQVQGAFADGSEFSGQNLGYTTPGDTSRHQLIIGEAGELRYDLPAPDSGAHWDALAPGWSAFESLGMTGESLRPFEARLRSPVLVLGAGQGQLVEWLLGQDHEVVGVDASAPMVEAARQRRGLELVLGRAEQLPLPDASFATAVVASGVLSPDRHDQLSAVMGELRRVSQPGAAVLVGLFCPAPGARELAGELGFGAGFRQHQDRLYAIWTAGRDPGIWAQQVQDWTGVEAAIAAARVRRWAAVLHAITDDLQGLADAARLAGADPELTLRRGLSFELMGVDASEARVLLGGVGLRELEVVVEPEVSTLTACGVFGVDLPDGGDRRWG